MMKLKDFKALQTHENFHLSTRDLPSSAALRWKQMFEVCPLLQLNLGF